MDAVLGESSETKQRIASGLSFLNSITSLFPSKYKLFHLLQNAPDAIYDLKDALQSKNDIPNWIHVLLDAGILVNLNKWHTDDALDVISNLDDGYTAFTGRDGVREIGQVIQNTVKDIKGLQITQEAKDNVEKQIQNFNVNHYANGGLIRKI